MRSPIAAICISLCVLFCSASQAQTPTTAQQTHTATPKPNAGHYTSEAAAQSHCPTDTVVWANTKSKIYHVSGSDWYGKTKQGAYMCQKESEQSGFRAAKNEKPATKKP